MAAMAYTQCWTNVNKEKSIFDTNRGEIEFESCKRC